MTHSLRFLAASAALLLTAGLRPAQAQCSRAGSHCVKQAQTAGDVPQSALLRVGAGLSLSGSGDYLVTKTHLEYAPTLGWHWRLGSRLAYISGSQPVKLGTELLIPQSYRALNAEQEIHWLPFGAGRLIEFGLGGGVFAGYAREMSVPQAGYTAGIGTANGLPRYDYISKREQGFHAGYIASLYLDCGLNEAGTWRLGGRLALQNDTRANILPGGQLQLSRAL